MIHLFKDTYKSAPLFLMLMKISVTFFKRQYKITYLKSRFRRSSIKIDTQNDTQILRDELKIKKGDRFKMIITNQVWTIYPKLLPNKMATL